MYYYYPGRKFPAVSVTGAACEVMCPHCQGRYLRAMIPAETPEKLVQVCRELTQAAGCLISGGCTASGAVPLPLKALQTIREETDLVLNVHTGLVDAHTAAGLNQVKPQYISFEVPTPYTLAHLYRISKTQQDYFTSLALLDNLEVVPHVMVGLEQSGELTTIKKIRDMGFSSLVLIVFMPTRGTPLYHQRINVEEVIYTVKRARELFTTLVLGCMRPRIKALEEQAPLFDGIVLPSKWAKEKVEEAKIPVEIRETCCVVK
jgi:uncharacterized radical SAM superfamily protein